MLSTVILGMYFLLFGQTSLLPVSHAEAQSAFEILIPVFAGQLTIVFQWFGDDKPTSRGRSAPRWIVVAPPLLVFGSIATTIVIMSIGNKMGADWTPSPDSFKGIVTFCVAVLNGSTVFIVGK